MNVSKLVNEYIMDPIYTILLLPIILVISEINSMLLGLIRTKVKTKSPFSDSCKE